MARSTTITKSNQLGQTNSYHHATITINPPVCLPNNQQTIPLRINYQRSELITNERNISVMRMLREWNIFLMLCEWVYLEFSIRNDFNFSSLVFLFLLRFLFFIFTNHPELCVRKTWLGEKFSQKFSYTRYFLIPSSLASASIGSVGKIEWRLWQKFAMRKIFSSSFNFSFFSSSSMMLLLLLLFLPTSGIRPSVVLYIVYSRSKIIHFNGVVRCSFGREFRSLNCFWRG